MRPLLAVAVLGSACLAALAQDDAPVAPPDLRAPVRARYATMLKAKQAHSDATSVASEKLRRQQYEAACDEFRVAFESTAWSDWDKTRDADILALGIDMCSRSAFAARDFARARLGWEFLADRLPRHPVTAEVIAGKLAAVYGSMGDLDEGASRLRRYVGSVSAQSKPAALISLGDLLAATSNFAASKKVYDEAATACARMSRKDAEIRQRQEALLTARKRVGETLADLWGTDPSSGKLVAFSLHAARRPAVCFLMSMGCLENEIKVATDLLQHHASGLAAFAATSWDVLFRLPGEDTAQVYLPPGPNESEGKVVGVSRNALSKHLETYRKRTKCGFPLVLAPDGALGRYVRALADSVFVLDSDRRVVWTGSHDFEASAWIAEAVALRHVAAQAPESK